jgi:hypothetical protein
MTSMGLTSTPTSSMETYFEVVAGFYDGGYVDTYAYASLASALNKAEQLRALVTSKADGVVQWIPMKHCVNEDGYEQVGWEQSRHDRYLYVGERAIHA